jgi:hypothetical protein
MKYFIAATGLFSIINLNITAKEIIIKQKLIESFEKTVPATENKLKSKSLKPTIFNKL